MLCDEQVAHTQHPHTPDKQTHTHPYNTNKQAPAFSIGQIKCLMQQLLEGVAFLHHSWVIHRDLRYVGCMCVSLGVVGVGVLDAERQTQGVLTPKEEVFFIVT